MGGGESVAASEILHQGPLLPRDERQFIRTGQSRRLLAVRDAGGTQSPINDLVGGGVARVTT